MTRRRRHKRLLCVDNDAETEIGRHPDQVSKAEWQSLGDAAFRTFSAAIRANCLGCAGNAAEVRKCVAVTCELWPFRLGRRPAALRRGMTEAQLLNLQSAQNARG